MLLKLISLKGTIEGKLSDLDPSSLGYRLQQKGILFLRETVLPTGS
mgnify:CR=1 FL=1